MCLHEPLPGPGERCADRSRRDFERSRDLSVIEPSIPKEEGLPISLAQRLERPADHGLPFALLELRGRIGGHGMYLRFRFQQCQVALPANRRTRFISGEVGRNGEQPSPRIVGILPERPDEGILCQIPRALHIPHLPMKEAHQVRQRGPVQFSPVYIHGILDRSIGLFKSNDERVPRCCTRGRAVVGTVSIIESNRALWVWPLLCALALVHTCGVDLLTSPEAWIALATLTTLEIVLGIDNIVFISVLADRLPHKERPKARQVGLLLAMLTRILLLFSITLIMRLTEPLFALFGHTVSGKDLILIVGGLFLLTKSTREIHDKMEGGIDEATGATKAATFGGVLIQIAILDIIFSLDSVITAVGMADELAVMVTAVILAVGVMMISAGPVGNFVSAHPTVKMLALSFLLLIGTSLIAEGVGFHIPKGYIYFAMGFSVFVEFLNLRAKRIRSSRDGVGVTRPATQGPSNSP